MFSYDLEWQRVARTAGAGTSDETTTQAQYDAVGNQVVFIDGRGKIWSTEYDARNRKVAIVDPLANRNEWVYDKAGNILEHRRANGGTWSNAYDEMDRLIQATDPRGQLAKLDYDAEGNLKKLIDWRSNILEFDHDLSSRLVKVTYPDASRETWEWDAADNVKVFTTRASQTRTYTYDSRNRQVSSDWSDDTPDVLYEYDQAGHLVTLSNSVSRLTYIHNDADELLSQTQDIALDKAGHDPKPRTIQYTIDPDGLVDSMTYPGGSLVSYTYTARNQTSSIFLDGGFPLAQYFYDLNDNRIAKNLENGTSVNYSYDDADRLSKIQHQKGVTIFGLSEYGYDSVNRKTFVAREDGRGDVYSYDEIDQVIGVLYQALNPGSVPVSPKRTVTYELDAAGNWTAVTDNSQITHSHPIIFQEKSAGLGDFALPQDGDEK